MRLATSLALILWSLWFATRSWFRFYEYPHSSFARRCGNCALAVIGVPLEISATALLIALRLHADVPFTADEAIWWVFLIVGVLGTPLVLGVPVFVVSSGILFCYAADRCLRSHRRPAPGRLPG